MQNNAFEQEVLKLTNEFRQKNGLKALVLDQSLEKAADQHTMNMAKQDFFSHTGKDGSRPWDRAQKAGYESGTVGENIAAGYRSAKAVVDGWINSPGHRANMLNANYNEIGLGYYFLENDTGSTNYNSYWTQLFGKGTIEAPNPTPTPTPTPTPPPTPNSNNKAVIQGTNRVDKLIGGSKDQRIFGRKGNDVIEGKGGKDKLYGHQGNDRILGGSGNDELYGGLGSDQLVGGDGNDRLQGSGQNRPGEKDVMTGGNGRDLFVLGDKNRTFYNDRSPKWMGLKDYALITDLKVGQGDAIQLSARHDYRLGSAPKGVDRGQALFIDNGAGQKDELIAVIQGTNNLNLNSSAFKMV